MLRLEEWMDIRSLHKEGHPIKEIARQTDPQHRPAGASGSWTCWVRQAGAKFMCG